MESSRINREGWLFGLAFLLALALRLVRLGAWPLTDLEAGPALQALHLTQGLKPALDPQPAYILLTAPLFFVFGGGTDFIARLIPALAGSFLVFVPLCFRHRIQPRPALLLAFFLALDPGLLAVSRQAGSLILAITFLLFAWALWERDQPRLSGFLAGLALLGGPSIWAGLIALGIASAWVILQGIKSRKSMAETPTPELVTEHRSLNIAQHMYPPGYPVATGNLRTALTSLLITVALIGTLFFLVPTGLSAGLASLPAYISGWWNSSGVPGGRLISALFFYQPLTVLLALVAVVRGWWNGDRGIISLGIWLLAALLLVVFYPAHQVTDLGWVVVPLCTLAALELARHFDIQSEERVEVAGVTILTAFILIFAWLDLASLMWVPVPSPDASLRAGLFLGSLLLLVISLLLVAFGWSIRAAQRGALWGAVIAFGVYSLSASLSAGGLRAGRTPELWQPGSYPDQAGLLASTIADLSEWQTGYVNSLPITITNIHSPALLWVLRDYQVDQEDNLDVTSAPPIVITSFEVDPSLAAAYRGQDFTWRLTPEWEGGLFSGPWDWLSHWLRWLIIRELPQTPETILLWARDDLFLDAVSSP